VFDGLPGPQLVNDPDRLDEAALPPRPLPCSGLLVDCLTGTDTEETRRGVKRLSEANASAATARLYRMIGHVKVVPVRASPA
jgi:hypothetical protein